MKKYVFKKYTKKSGSLTPFSLKFDIPFKTKRIFLIYGNKNFIRGDHAHFRCKQFLIPIFGNKLIYMAERMGFEPMKEFLLYTLSKRAPSTTRPPLQIFIVI